MSLFLNVLFVLVSVMYMTGRLYEISTLMDISTGFITVSPVVTSVAMMAIICIIAVCCGVIIFSAEKTTKKIRQMPVGILGIMAGVFFVAGGVVNSLNCFKYGGFILYHGMEILGGVGLVLLGITNIKGKSREKIPVVLTLMIPAGVCMNSILHEIRPLADTDFLMRSMAGLLSLVFFTLLFKMAYAPNKITKLLLYIFSLINFVFTGIGSLAAVLGSIITATVNFPQLLYNVGFIFIGFYSVFIAFFISPSKIRYSDEDSVRQPEKVKKVSKPAEIKEPIKEYIPAQPEEAVVDYDFTVTNSGIDQNVIAELFAKKERHEKETEAPEIEAIRSKENPIEKTAPVYVPEKTVPKQETDELTTIIPMNRTKSVYKGDGRKSTTKKIVYKAPK